MNIAQRLKDVAVSDTGFVFDPITGLTFSVNTTGKFILDQLRQGKSADEIVAAIAENFDVTDRNEVMRDLKEFLRLLKENGILPKDAEA